MMIGNCTLIRRMQTLLRALSLSDPALCDYNHIHFVHTIYLQPSMLDSCSIVSPLFPHRKLD